MDDDSNGCIERDEIPKAIWKIGSDVPPKVIDAIIKSLDQNRAEAFNYREIASALSTSNADFTPIFIYTFKFRGLQARVEVKISRI